MIDCCDINVRRPKLQICQEQMGVSNAMRYQVLAIRRRRLLSLPSMLCSVPSHRWIAQGRVLSLPCRDPLAPHFKRTAQHLAAH